MKKKKIASVDIIDTYNIEGNITRYWSVTQEGGLLLKLRVNLTALIGCWFAKVVVSATMASRFSEADENGIEGF